MVAGLSPTNWEPPLRAALGSGLPGVQRISNGDWPPGSREEAGRALVLTLEDGADAHPDLRDDSSL